MALFSVGSSLSGRALGRRGRLLGWPPDRTTRRSRCPGAACTARSGALSVGRLRGLLPFLRPYRAQITPAGLVPPARRGKHRSCCAERARSSTRACRRRSGRPDHGAAQSFLRAVRRRRCARRVLGGALLHRELVRRARHRGPGATRSTRTSSGKARNSSRRRDRTAVLSRLTTDTTSCRPSSDRARRSACATR